jgi:adenosylcobinamide-GDP ribazoletransferase
MPQGTSETPAPTGGCLAIFGGIRTAVIFLTRIPTGRGTPSAAAWGWAPAWFPLVGAVLGLAGSLVYFLLSRAGGLVAAGATLAVLALLTGAMHEDGLADTADALGGGRDRARVFAILKDSRIGSFGATALGLALLLRAGSLASLGPRALWALPLVGLLSRLTPVWLMASLPYVTPTETARSSDVVRGRRAPAAVATCLAVAVCAALWFIHAVSLFQVGGVFSASLVVTGFCGWRFFARAGGITGDFLGATQQITEVVLLVLLAAWI